MPSLGQIALLVLIVWLTQLALSYRQARLFSKRIRELRKLGLCATGLSGGMYRGRTYVALVVDPSTRRVLKAELLQGLTVFAGLKVVPQLEGFDLQTLLADPPPVVNGVSAKVIEAARSAGNAIQASLTRASLAV